MYAYAHNMPVYIYVSCVGKSRFPILLPNFGKYYFYSSDNLITMKEYAS